MEYCIPLRTNGNSFKQSFFWDSTNSGCPLSVERGHEQNVTPERVDYAESQGEYLVLAIVGDIRALLPETAGERAVFLRSRCLNISGNRLVKIQKSGWNFRKLKIALTTPYRSRMRTYNYVAGHFPGKRMVCSFVLAFLRIFPPAHKSEEEK